MAVSRCHRGTPRSNRPSHRPAPQESLHDGECRFDGIGARRGTDRGAGRGHWTRFRQPRALAHRWRPGKTRSGSCGGFCGAVWRWCWSWRHCRPEIAQRTPLTVFSPKYCAAGRSASRPQSLLGRSGSKTRTPIFTVVIAMCVIPEDPVGAETVKTIVQATLEEPNQKTSEISTDDLRGILATGSAVVFDARPPREYAMSHIPGAINVRGKPGLSMSQYVPDAGEIIRALDGDKASPIVLYCSGPFCGRSKRLSEELLAAGFTNVRRYQLG